MDGGQPFAKHGKVNKPATPSMAAAPSAGNAKEEAMPHHRSSALTWAVVLVVMTAAVILPPPARGAEQLTYRLKWLFNTSVVGDLYADAHGDFAAAGLDVTIKPGGPERDCHQRTRAGAGPVRRGVRRPGDPGQGQGIPGGRHRAAVPGKSPAMDLPQIRSTDRPTVGLAGADHRHHLRRQR